MKIKTSLTESSVRIDIPFELVEYLASNSIDYQAKISNREKLFNYVKDNIIDNYSGEEQWSDFEMLLEEVIIRAAENNAGLELV